MLDQNTLKRNAALAAVEYVLPLLNSDSVVGVGTGSTVDFFIDALAPHKHCFRAAVSSSERSSLRMSAAGIAVLDLNDVETMPVYVDGADEIDADLSMIKGGGGALTREKIVASVAQQFVCIVDESKLVSKLGAFPLPIEVIPMAMAAVTRSMVRMGGKPIERAGFVTDNGCRILDVSGLDMTDPLKMETRINDIPGVVTCGLFAISGADVALISGQSGVQALRSMTNSQ